MSNKIETVSIGDLPIATELDDADELLLRDVSATLPENATARLSIATLRAAMGGGSPDRIESESGAAFAEATDDFAGAGFPGSKIVARSNGASAQVSTAAGLDGNLSFAQVWAGENGITNNGALFRAGYSAETDEKELRAIGAPLEIEEPVESNHAATKGYVDARPGADAWSKHAATQDVDLDGHKLTGLGEPTESNHAATKGYVDSKVASMPAPPDLEWWEPTWTAIENVDSVTNVECQYTRTYRAAGGSLVTLEGMIEVMPDAAGECAVQVDLPIARVGSDPLAGTAIVLGGVAVTAALAVVGSTTLTLGFIAEGVHSYVVSFRASYRAA